MENQRRSKYSPAQIKRRKKKRRRSIIAVCVIFLVVAVITTALLFGVNALVDRIKTKKPGESVEPTTSVEPTPASTEEFEPTIWESEPAVENPAESMPAVYEENGANFVDIEGIKLLIVNKVYALSSSFGGEDPAARAALERMIDAASADGIHITIVSGYRSYEDQASIHQGWINTYGVEYAKKISAEPGHSEHQTGLAFDLNSLSTSFSETAEYAWLIEHCAEYGFIERYLEEKVWATGYNYEPWHYRYIGDAALAKKIMESGLSLEEYAALTGIDDADKQMNSSQP